MKYKYTAILFLIVSVWFNLHAQNPNGAHTLVEEGVAYHDKGDYEGAINKYNLALQIDKDNLRALYEKAYTLLAMNKHDETLECCSLAISAHPRERLLAQVYVIMGNTYDALKKTDKSIETYNDALKMFPDEYMLYFNKGITLVSVRKYDEAITCFKKALQINPDHPGSHNALARSLEAKNKRIPALLATLRFLTLEPTGKRAKVNVELLEKLMTSNVSDREGGGLNLIIDSKIFGDTTAKGTPNEYNFSSIEMLMALNESLLLSKPNVTVKEKLENGKDTMLNKGQSDKTIAELIDTTDLSTNVGKFIKRFTTLCSLLGQSKNEHSGFYWEYYVPYFVEMKEKKHLTTFAYIAYYSTEEQYVVDWVKANKPAIDAFLKWSKNYKWASY